MSSLGIIGGADGPTAIFVTGSPTKALLLYLLAVNLLAFALYGIDKWKAKQHAWRISEKVLFIVPLLGGSIGAIAGMKAFHHKTKHWYFRFGIPAILILQVALTLWLTLR